MKYKIPISIIMPCYNSEDFISEAILSILNQSYSFFELIIVDDASTDNTEIEVRKFKDSRIRYFKRPKNMGDNVARNFGLSLAEGKYICVMDSEDLAPLNRLKLQYDYLENHLSVGGLGGSFEIIDENNEVIGIAKRPTSYPKIKTWLLKNNYVSHPIIMMRSHLIKKHKLFYSNTNKYAGDYECIDRAAQLFPIRNLDEILLSRRIHPTQMSAVTRKEQKECVQRVRERQIKRLGVIYSDEEMKLHEKLMEEEYIEEVDLKKCENWLNKLYEANYQKKMYNKKHLYDLFEWVLIDAQRESVLRQISNS